MGVAACLIIGHHRRFIPLESYIYIFFLFSFKGNKWHRWSGLFSFVLSFFSSSSKTPPSSLLLHLLLFLYFVSFHIKIVEEPKRTGEHQTSCYQMNDLGKIFPLWRVTVFHSLSFILSLFFSLLNQREGAEQEISLYTSCFYLLVKRRLLYIIFNLCRKCFFFYLIRSPIPFVRPVFLPSLKKKTQAKGNVLISIFNPFFFFNFLSWFSLSLNILTGTSNVGRRCVVDPSTANYLTVSFGIFR